MLLTWDNTIIVRHIKNSRNNNSKYYSNEQDLDDRCDVNDKNKNQQKFSIEEKQQLSYWHGIKALKKNVVFATMPDDVQKNISNSFYWVDYFKIRK